ncbi:MAG: hypothetical protein WDZ59_05955 [Pirellulales bacterium]
MMELVGSPLWWTFGAVQIGGLVAAWLTRLSQGQSCQSCCQWAFLVALSMVAITTMASVIADNGSWVVPAGTLSIMILAATCDFRQHQPASQH